MGFMGFDKLKKKLTDRPGVANPGGLAASIGRKKYGAKAFDKHAAEGESMKGLDAAVKHGKK